MDKRSRLSVIYSNGVTDADYSVELQDFRRDPVNLTLEPTDFIYVGYYKPINALYAYLTAFNTNVSSLDLEYYSTSGWAPLAATDETRAFTRSGFITWDRPEDSTKTTVAGINQHWIRIAANDSLSLATFQALNILFSDDNDISQEVPALIDDCFYQQNQTSHTLHHAASKNYIMGRLRSLQYIKHTENGEENINEWDLLDIYELRQASTYYTISQIYFNLSDNPEDAYWSKYQDYIKRFEECFNLGRLRIDQNDNGKVDLEEKRPIKTIRWNR